MEKEKVIYKLKCLEKEIIRTILQEVSNDKNSNNNSCLTPTQMQIIGYTYNNSKDVYQKDLEDILNLRRATISGVLKTMEKNNLIEREISKADARSRKIILKDKAKIIYKENKARLDNIENILKKDINPKDLIIFTNIIAKMKENLKSYNERGGNNYDKTN